jgi:hypothetical protein
MGHRRWPSSAGQTHRQPDEPAQTRRVECRLSGICNPAECMTFKRFACSDGSQNLVTELGEVVW